MGKGAIPMQLWEVPPHSLAGTEPNYLCWPVIQPPSKSTMTMRSSNGVKPMVSLLGGTSHVKQEASDPSNGFRSRSSQKANVNMENSDSPNVPKLNCLLHHVTAHQIHASWVLDLAKIGS